MKIANLREREGGKMFGLSWVHKHAIIVSKTIQNIGLQGGPKSVTCCFSTNGAKMCAHKSCFSKVERDRCSTIQEYNILKLTKHSTRWIFYIWCHT